MTAEGLAVGIGCRSGIGAADVEEIVALVLKNITGRPLGLYTIADRLEEAGLQRAAARLGLPLHGFERHILQVQNERSRTRSDWLMDRFGIASVAETAALAGAGAGSWIVVPRLVKGRATCAVARARDAS